MCPDLVFEKVEAIYGQPLPTSFGNNGTLYGYVAPGGNLKVNIPKTAAKYRRISCVKLDMTKQIAPKIAYIAGGIILIYFISKYYSRFVTCCWESVVTGGC